MTASNGALDSSVEEDRGLSFEEFKLYYESAEKVTERRLAMNRWNYSISVATLIAIGALINWSSTKSRFMLVGICGVVVLSLMAIVFCTYWLRQIADFKALNSAKFAILNEMAPRLIFDPGPDGRELFSFRPFEKEWERLQEAHALAEVPTFAHRILALKSSSAEYFIPKAFRVLFVGVFLFVLIAGAVSWRTVLRSPFAPTGSMSQSTVGSR